MLENRHHEVFCLEYVKDFNAGRSYKAAYPDCQSEGASRVNGARLLTDANVMHRIEELSGRLQVKAENDITKIIRENERIAYLDITKVLDFSGDFLVVKSLKDIPEEARRAIAEVKQIPATKESGPSLHIKFWDKQKALDSLARYHGIFKDKLDVIHYMTVEQIVQKAKKEDQDGAS